MLETALQVPWKRLINHILRGMPRAMTRLQRFAATPATRFGSSDKLRGNWPLIAPCNAAVEKDVAAAGIVYDASDAGEAGSGKSLHRKKSPPGVGEVGSWSSSAMATLGVGVVDGNVMVKVVVFVVAVSVGASAGLLGGGLKILPVSGGFVV